MAFTRGARQTIGSGLSRTALLITGTGLVFGLAVTTTVGAAPASAARASDVLVVAHRGASGVAPENTLAAIREAIAQRADLVEIDVQMSADGEIVLMHDTTLARTTDVEDVFPDRAPWNVTDFTLAELRQLDAGSWFDEDFAGEPVPTLREALLVMRGHVGLWLELKAPELYPGLETATADVLRTTPGGWLRAAPRARKLTSTSFNFDSLLVFDKEIDAVAPAGGIDSDVPDDATLRDVATWMEYYVVNYRQLQPGDVVRMRDAGLDVAFWTVNDPESTAALIGQGADAIITNYPAVARAVAQDRDPFPGPETVVVEESVNNVPGDDVAPENGEHVILRNVSDEPVDVGGWYLRDSAYNRLWIGEGYVIPPHGTLAVYTGPGTDTADRYYNGRTRSILNNGGDSVALHRADNTVVDVFGNDLTS